MKSWLALSFYLQWVLPWKTRWKNAVERRRHTIDRSVYAADISTLSTPYRLATYVDAHFVEDPAASWLDPPLAAEITWARRRGGGSEFARFSQEVMAHHGIETYLLTVIVPPLGEPTRPPRGADLGADPLLLAAARQPDRWHGHVVCAIRDPDTGGWFHFSEWGMFGIYADWDEIAADISPRWSVYGIRDTQLGWRGWRRREAGTRQRVAGHRRA